MLTIIIFTIAFIGYGIYSAYKSWYSEIEDYFINSFTALLVGPLVGFLVAWAIPADLYIEETEKSIEVLNDNSSVSGSFFLGSGQVEGKMKYVFYSKKGNRFKLNQVDYNDAEIEYSRQDPAVVIFKEKYSTTYFNLFAIDFTDTWYLFKIPEGSISNGFNLDAK